VNGAPRITGVILAGGRGSRMDGADKGLVAYQGRPLVEHVIERLRPQVDTLLINANRNIDAYARYGYALVRDSALPGVEDYPGPLAGIFAALVRATTESVAIVPCDVPQLPHDLVPRLVAAREQTGARACYAYDGQQAHFVCALLSISLQDALRNFLSRGERKLEFWLKEVGAVAVDFSDQPHAFRNVNYFEDLK
jgi:molybdopterin-guanine dinucleotide biosynthesis protein A